MTAVERILLVAARGLARETLSSIRQTGDWEVDGFLDDDPNLAGTFIEGVRVLGPLELAVDSGDKLLVCAGAGHVRESIVSRLASWGVGPEAYATHVHASVWRSAECRIGHGSILLAGCVLTSAVALGTHVVAMPHVIFTHDVQAGDFATFAAGVSLGGGVGIGRSAYLGMNSVVRQGLHVGQRSMLGMGAVLTRDLPQDQIWAGNPARLLEQRTSVKENEDACVN